MNEYPRWVLGQIEILPDGLWVIWHNFSGTPNPLPIPQGVIQEKFCFRLKSRSHLHIAQVLGDSVQRLTCFRS